MIQNSDFVSVFNKNIEHKFIAPARINLIGEHIDYNGGMVLPCAISLYLRAYVSLRDDLVISLKSTSFNNVITKSYNDLYYDSNNKWANYPIGVIKTLFDKGYKINKGLNIYFDSDIPLGSGLSSSAAILDLTVFICNELFELNIDRKNMALIAQEVENNYCGLSSGIMDEAIISLGMKNKALLLDCKNFNYKYIDIKDGDYTYVVMKTNKPRKLTESKYNERVYECNKALKIIQTTYNVKTLCEIKTEDLANIEALLQDKILFKRVRHVVKENERVYEYTKALIKGEYIKLGTLLNASDESLRDDYEVTGKHLDLITNAARKAGAIGARMTGAGFGGCAIALIKREMFDEFSQKVSKEYFEQTKIKPEFYLVDIVDGTSRVE